MKHFTYFDVNIVTIPITSTFDPFLLSTARLAVWIVLIGESDERAIGGELRQKPSLTKCNKMVLAGCLNPHSK